MPFASVKLVPGVNTEMTPTLNEAGYSESTFIRWKNGLAQKIGGWERYYVDSLSGVPRALHAWQDLNETGRLAAGATQELAILTSGNLSVVTPQEMTTDGAVFECSNLTGTTYAVDVTDSEVTGITSAELVYFNTPIAIGDQIVSAGWHSITQLGATKYRLTFDGQVSGTLSLSTATVTIAPAGGAGTAAVISWTAHALAAGRMVKFTGGTLPTGMTDGATYYVSASSLNVNDFRITDLNGTTILITGSSSPTVTGTAFYGTVPVFQTLSTDAVEALTSATVTISIATPGVVTWTAHGFATGQTVSFVTTGALPTGLTAGTKYYVSATGNTTDTFQLATSYANAVAGTPVVNTSGTQSGVQTGIVYGSSNIVVTIPEHGLAIGDTVNFPISTTLGAASYATSVFGTYAATSIVDTDNFKIKLSSVTSAPAKVAMNDDQAQILYAITQGTIPDGGVGYGIGGYGDGGYGTGDVPGGLVGTPITATNWSLDNWGSDLIANPANQGLFFWNPIGGNSNASLIPAAPPFNGGCFVAMPAQILVAWGSTSTQNIGVDQDPLLIKWSDQLDYANWTVSTTTQAGSFHIPTGSKIVGGLQGPQNALIWTDLDVWAMQYVGYPLVFGFNKIGANCGLIGQHAATQMGGMVYWMGRSNFFALTGNGAEPIPCTVWDKVFQNLDATNGHKSVAAANSTANEIWWFYPSDGSSEPDSYVKLNVVEGAWDYGTLSRTAWIDQSVLGTPIGASQNGVIYQHEMGYDADGNPITSSFTTGYFRIVDGQDMAFVDVMIPDMRYGLINGDQDAELTVTFYSQMYPSDTPVEHGPYTFDASTQQIYTRIRGRQIAFKVESSDLGSFWRLGKLTYRVAMDGRR